MPRCEKWRHYSVANR